MQHSSRTLLRGFGWDWEAAAFNGKVAYAINVPTSGKSLLARRCCRRAPSLEHAGATGRIQEQRRGNQRDSSCLADCDAASCGIEGIFLHLCYVSGN
jgi:hypothetical protein